MKPQLFFAIAAVVLLSGMALGSWTLFRWFRPEQRKRPAGVLVALLSLLAASAVSIALFFVWSVSRQWVPNPSTTRLTLPSGHQVEVVWQGVRQIHEPTWVIEYRTYVSMAKGEHWGPPLWREAKDILKELPDAALQSGVARVRLWPQSFDHEVWLDGFRTIVVSGNATAFDFTKKPDGTWEQVGGWRGP
jgi:hypothetical protein